MTRREWLFIRNRERKSGIDQSVSVVFLMPLWRWWVYGFELGPMCLSAWSPVKESLNLTLNLHLLIWKLCWKREHQLNDKIALFTLLRHHFLILFFLRSNPPTLLAFLLIPFSYFPPAISFFMLVLMPQTLAWPLPEMGPTSLMSAWGN